MLYCSNCILPETRPGLKMGSDGVCSACKQHGRKNPEIDWGAREKQFKKIVSEVKEYNREYDCVVPVSGGKDSTWQIVRCLEYGLKPLAVTWRTPARTPLGQRNLDNLIGLGVNHIDFSINPEVERRFLLASLQRYGTTAIPMHLAIFNIPMDVAVKYSVPLVVWGENSALEYIGENRDANSFELTKEWVKKYGAVHGTTVDDWVSDNLSMRDLIPYRGPSDDQLQQAGIRAFFLGMFFQWDPQKTFEIAKKNGFVARSEGPKTGFYDYADIDDEFISIHHWLKWYKFGFTRLWDNLSLEIRNGRVTREEAINIVKSQGDQTPESDIKVLCQYLQITVREFYTMTEKFRNKNIWTKYQGVWKLNDFLISDWKWK